MPPEISVVIPTLARTSVLENCLNSLARQEVRDFEVIIVSLETDALSPLQEKFPDLNILVIPQQKQGLVFARNLGLAHCRGRIVSFIDDDVTLSSSWCKEILISFSESGDIGGVSGPTIIPQELLSNRDILSFQAKQERVLLWKLLGRIYNYFVLENTPYAIGKIFKSGAFSLGANYPQAGGLISDIEVEYLEACNMSFRKDILEKIGGFSLEYGRIGDWSEPDLAFRVKRQGFRLFFNPRATVMHHLSQRGVFNERGRDSYQRMRNFMHFYFKWIKPNTPNKAIRFGANLLFLNIYWCYKFFETNNAEWLDGIRGTFGCLKR